MNRWIGTTALTTALLLAGGAAWAADPVYPVQPGFTWTGVHFGVGAGYGGAEHNVGLDLGVYTDGGLGEIDTGSFFPEPVEGFDLYSIGASMDFGGKGAIGTVEVGYDHQFGRFILGLQADYTFSAIRTEGSIFGDVCYERVGVSDSCDSTDLVIEDTPSLDYVLNTGDVVNLSARAGILATPRTLLYAMAGYSYTKMNAALSFNSDPISGELLSYDYARQGVTVGVGVETLLSESVSAKLEYRGTMWSKINEMSEDPFYAAFGDEGYVQTIRGVLSYRFNTGSGLPEPVEYHFDPSAPFSWTALHVGAGGGYGVVNHNTGIEYFDESDGGMFALGLPEEAFPEGAVYGFDLHSIGAGIDVGGRGAVGTVEGGLDVQLGKYFVVGIQADYTWSDMKSVAEVHGEVCYELTIEPDSCSLDGPGAIIDDELQASYTLDTGDSWSVIGRAGFLPGPRTLIYGLAGYTHTDMSAVMGVSSDEFGFEPLGSYGYTRKGLTVGAGIETMITNSLSAKLEYRATNWSNEEVFPTGEDTGIRFWDDSLVQTGRAVLSYRLGVNGH